jgi:hypothetical protein
MVLRARYKNKSLNERYMGFCKGVAKGMTCDAFKPKLFRVIEPTLNQANKRF